MDEQDHAAPEVSAPDAAPPPAPPPAAPGVAVYLTRIDTDEHGPAGRFVEIEGEADPAIFAIPDASQLALR